MEFVNLKTIMKGFYIHFVSLICFLCLCTFSSMAQEMDKNLAEQYLRNGEFEKAVVLYQKLYDKEPTQINYYNSLLNCFIVLKQFPNAIKLTQKQIKKNSKILKYRIDLGYALEWNKDSSKANKEFDNTIKDLKADEGEIRQIADAFSSYGKLEWVVKTYERGAKILKNDLVFLFDLARAYTTLKDHKKAISAYLTLLELDPMQIQGVKNTFQTNLENKSFTKELSNQIYSKLQKSPDEEIWNDLAIWIAPKVSKK